MAMLNNQRVEDILGDCMIFTSLLQTRHEEHQFFMETEGYGAGELFHRSAIRVTG